MSLINSFSDEYSGMYDTPEEPEEPRSLELCQEDLDNLDMTFDEIRDYLNAEVHKRCDYDIYCYLMDKLDAVERVFND